MNDILGAYKSKGDGDREMLLALLNAKAAEENVSIHRSVLRAHIDTSRQRVAAITTLHRTLLDLYNGTGLPPTDVAESAERHCVFPSPPSSSYQHSPTMAAQVSRPRRRKSASPSSAYSSEGSMSPNPRKRHRSRSPAPRERRSRPHYDSLNVPALEPSSFPPSPYSSSSQSSIGSPRSRESMTIGALLTPLEKDIDMDDRRLSSPRIRRDTETSLSHRA